MRNLPTHIRRQLATNGWAVFDSESARETRATLDELGELVRRDRISHRPDPRAALVEAEDMRIHSSHPRIRWVAWHCVREAQDRSAILLRDAGTAFLSLPQGAQEALRHTTMGFSSQFDGDPERCPVSREAFGVNDWLFFAPWFWREGADENLDAFVTKLRQCPPDRVHLVAGQVLLVDNARTLHGFEPTHDPRDSLLLRHWIAAKQPTS